MRNIRTTTRAGVRLVAGALAAGALTALVVASPAGAQSAPGSAGPQTREPAAEASACSFGQWPADVEGRPATLAAGAASGVYLWHDAYGWHARVTHPGHTPAAFHVTVVSSGRIYGIERFDEAGDEVTVSGGARRVELHATNFGYLDGMDFRTVCAEHIVVSGTIDGRQLTTSQVFLGADGSHPTSVPFAVERQP